MYEGEGAAGSEHLNIFTQYFNQDWLEVYKMKEKRKAKKNENKN